MRKLFVIIALVAISIKGLAQIADKATDIAPLLVGESLPDMQVVSGSGKSHSLSAILKEKPTVLVFYRGGWCPYCNAQLSALAESEAEILKLGYQIVAVSPEQPENIRPTSEADKIAYRVFSDPKGELLQKVGIAFKTPEQYKGYIAPHTKGKVSEVLPVPTVMIVNTAGQIMFEYINPDFKMRLSRELLMAVLPVLK